MNEFLSHNGSGPLPTLKATRYVTPLREGGSLPAIVEADDGALYVMKFFGAGQGPKALVAELLAGEIARLLGLRVPELVVLELDAALSRSEPHQEIQDLLRASVGLNLGLRYLPSALAFNPLLTPPPTPELASEIVWFDAYVTNVDRTPRNTNMLIWHKELWLIDHGAALYFHHNWGGDYLAGSRTPFAFIKEHVLLPYADSLAEADARLRPRLTRERLAAIVELVPAAWLGTEERFPDTEAHRQAYVDYLVSRCEAADRFLQEAINARQHL